MREVYESMQVACRTSVSDLSLAHQVRLVGHQYDRCGRVLVVALKIAEHIDDVVVRVAISHRVQQDEAVHVAVITLVVLHITNTITTTTIIIIIIIITLLLLLLLIV